MSPQTPASERVRVLAVAGSLRAGSHNRRLLRVVQNLAPEGVEFVPYLGLADIEPFNEDSEFPEPPGVAALRAAVRKSHGVFISTPEYNASIPGQLKNALDWLSRSDTEVAGLPGSAMYGRPVAVVSASAGQFGAVWAAQELRKALKTQGARVVEEPQVAVGGGESAFALDDEKGGARLVSSEAERRLVELLDALVAQARVLESAGIALVTGVS